LKVVLFYLAKSKELLPIFHQQFLNHHKHRAYLEFCEYILFQFTGQQKNSLTKHCLSV